MNTFREDELVTVQGRTFPVVGGRLRLAHEGNAKISITSEIVKFEPELVIVRAVVCLELKGSFSGLGVATAADVRMSESLASMAETRAVARALRFAGYGIETCGIEEVGDLFTPNQPETAATKPPLRVVGGNGGNTAKPANGGQQAPKGNGGMVKPSDAQQKAIYALSKKLGLTSDQAVAKVYAGETSKTITLVQASALIDRLKAKAGNGNGSTVNK